MKRVNKIAAAIAATAISTSAFVAPTTASAETTANIGVSNMYLWRGQNLSPTGGVVSGGLDYSHESGAYAGLWTTSETDGHETDLYLGFGGEAGGLSYDISYWEYLYPEDGKLEESNLSEVVVSAGYSMITATAYISVDDEFAGASDDWVYYTVGADVGRFNVTYGQWTGLDANNYSHVTASFAATDDLSLSISVAQEDDVNIEEDPLFAVSWGQTFDVK